MFETPISENATFPVNLTWNPRTFNPVNYGNFLFNLWLLRDDAQGDTVVSVHLPYLLASDHNVYNYSVLWTPTLNDIDINVPQAGTHQLAWEQSKNNPGLDPSNTSFEGYSRGFNFRAPISSSSSSILAPAATSVSNPSATSSTSITSSRPKDSNTSNSTSSSSATSDPTVIGLVVGLVLAALLFIAAAFWGGTKVSTLKKESTESRNYTTWLYLNIELMAKFTTTTSRRNGRISAKRYKTGGTTCYGGLSGDILHTFCSYE